jgi:hypothetical protein
VFAVIIFATTTLFESTSDSCLYSKSEQYTATSLSTLAIGKVRVCASMLKRFHSQIKAFSFSLVACVIVAAAKSETDAL